MTDYLLDADPDERRRLLAQGNTFSPEAERLLDRCGLGPGHHAVDLGCGPLGLLAAMSQRVGPAGRVVGVDRDADMVAAARAATASLGNVEVRQGSADDTGLARAGFDLVHARLVLVNVPDPGAVVRSMAALVRPSGHVALQDIDWANRLCEPPHPAWDRIVEVVRELWAGSGQDVHVGRRLPGLLVASGLIGVRTDAATRIFQHGDPEQTLMADRAERCRDALVERGLIGHAELDDRLAELRAHLAEPTTVVLHGTLVQAWGRGGPASDRVATGRGAARRPSRRDQYASYFDGLDVGLSAVPAEPFRITDDAAGTVCAAARRLVALLGRAVRESGTGPDEWLAALGETRATYPLLTGPDDLDDLEHTTFRPDIVFHRGVARFLEFNVSSGIGGVPQTQQYGRLWRDIAGGDVADAAPCDARARFLAGLHEREDGRGTVPIVASVEDLGSSRVVDLELEALERLGHSGRHLAPYELPAVADGVRPDRFGPGLLYMTAAEWSALGIDLDPLLRILRGRRLVLHSSQTCELLGNKRVLAWLSTGPAWLTPDDRTLVDRHIPWTRETGDTLVGPNGRRVDTESFAIAHRPRLVLKTNIGMQADGVTVGSDVDPDVWRDRVRGAVEQNDAILQQYLAADRCRLSVHRGGRPDEPVGVRTVWNPFFFGEHFGGFGVRYSMDECGTGPISGSTGALASSAVVAPVTTS